MGLLDRVAAQVGMAAPRPRLRVVAEDERPAPVTRTARPEALASFIGQQSTVFNLTIEAEAAAMDNRLPDHVLLCGPAGVGKTSLARCLADRLGVRFIEIPATSLDKVGDVANALAGIGQPEDGPAVVFCDEVHGVCRKGQLLMLSALEDGWIQPSGCERLQLAPFVMVAASTNAGLMAAPLRQRFGVVENLTYYDEDDLALIVARYAETQSVKLEDGVADLIASVGRGTPRVAVSILRRVATLARVGGSESITTEDAAEALERYGIDSYGLDRQDRALLGALCGQPTPVGVDALAAQLGTDSDSITQREPYLLRTGLMRRSSRGRVATRQGYRCLGLKSPVWLPQ